MTDKKNAMDEAVLNATLKILTGERSQYADNVRQIFSQKPAKESSQKPGESIYARHKIEIPSTVAHGILAELKRVEERLGRTVKINDLQLSWIVQNWQRYCDVQTDIAQLP